MKDLIKCAKQLIADKKVSLVGGDERRGFIYSCGEETVKIYPKPGRKETSCSCENFARFCNTPRICYHLIAVILFESNKGFYEKIDKLILDYEEAASIGANILVESILLDLKDLRRFK